jgi:hypothetical protein
VTIPDSAAGTQLRFDTCIARASLRSPAAIDSKSVISLKPERLHVQLELLVGLLQGQHLLRRRAARACLMASVVLSPRPRALAAASTAMPPSGSAEGRADPRRDGLEDCGEVHHRATRAVMPHIVSPPGSAGLKLYPPSLPMSAAKAWSKFMVNPSEGVGWSAVGR